MSLKDKAMLVSISVTKPKMTERDKQASTEVAFAKNASEEAVSVTKKLYPKHLIAPINEIESAARRYVESVTRPWGRNLALLPCAGFMDFQQKIGQFKLQFEQAVTVFLSNFASVMQMAQQQQGTMFDQSVYPDLTDMKAGFSFGVKYLPLSDAPSIVLDLEAQVLTELRAEIEEQTKAALADGQRDMYSRLGDAVKRIADQCKKEKGKIYDSLTGNLAELLTILPQLNLTDDQQFASLCAEAQQLVVAPEALRTVPEVRQHTAKVADDILAKMKAFL